jgi:hypothetical protein
MRNRAAPVNLIMSLVGFVVFMVLVLVVVGGFGVGTVEMVIWLALLVIGVGMIVGRYVAASRPSA